MTISQHNLDRFVRILQHKSGDVEPIRVDAFRSELNDLFSASGLSEDDFEFTYWFFFINVASDGWPLEYVVEQANYVLLFCDDIPRPPGLPIGRGEPMEAAFTFALVVVHVMNEWAYLQITEGCNTERVRSSWVLPKLVGLLSDEGEALLTQHPDIYNEVMAYYTRTHATRLDIILEESELRDSPFWALYGGAPPPAFGLSHFTHHGWSTPETAGTSHLNWLCRRLSAGAMPYNTATAAVHVVDEHFVFVEFPRAFDQRIDELGLKPNTLRNQLTREGLPVRSQNKGVFHKAICGGRICHGLLYPLKRPFSLPSNSSAFIDYDVSQIGRITRQPKIAQ